jgi:hypothetical protein
MRGAGSRRRKEWGAKGYDPDAWQTVIPLDLIATANEAEKRMRGVSGVARMPHCHSHLWQSNSSAESAQLA